MNSKVTGEGAAADDDDDVKKKNIGIFTYKQRRLSMDMKTKIVQHVSKINLSHFKFSNFQFFLVPSFCLTFRRFFTSGPSPVTRPIRGTGFIWCLLI